MGTSLAQEYSLLAYYARANCPVLFDTANGIVVPA